MINRNVTTYDPKRVIITFGGIPISGFASGTFINATPSSDRFSKVVGADGEVSRSKSADETSEVTITLLQSSLSNQYLSGVESLDRLTDKGILPLTITDLNGGTLKFWPQAWITKAPDLGFAAEHTDREWTFNTGNVAASNTGAILR